MSNVEPKSGSTYTVEEIRELIGCEWVTIIHLGGGSMLVVDEEGKMNNKPVNSFATQLAKDAKINMLDYVVGDVLLIRTEELN